MIEVVVGIVTEDMTVGSGVKILLCQRKRASRYGLKWEFPGGKVEQGETPSDALRRELREELNIDAEIGELFHRQSSVYPDSGTFDVHYFLVERFSGKIVNHVFEGIAWVPLQEFGGYDILEGNADVVEKLVQFHAKRAVEKE